MPPPWRAPRFPLAGSGCCDTAAKSSSGPAVAATPLLTRRDWAALLTIGFGVSLVIMDATTVNVALLIGTLGRATDADLAALSLPPATVGSVTTAVTESAGTAIAGLQAQPNLAAVAQAAGDAMISVSRLTTAFAAVGALGHRAARDLPAAAHGIGEPPRGGPRGRAGTAGGDRCGGERRPGIRLITHLRPRGPAGARRRRSHRCRPGTGLPCRHGAARGGGRRRLRCRRRRGR